MRHCRAVKAEKLAFLTDIEGVYKDPSDPSTLISELRVDEARKLMDSGYIGGGMLPKLQNLHRCHRGGCLESTYSGRADPTLSAP